MTQCPRYSILPLLVFLAGCQSGSELDGDEPSRGGASASTPDSGSSGGDRSAQCSSLVGASAGGTTNVVSEGWPEAPVRFGDNIKMLNFEQLKTEVLAVTGVESSDLASKGAVFGAADYQTVFQDDRTPTSSKLIAYRKVVYQACSGMMTREAAARALFSEVAPTSAIDAQEPKVAAQVKKVFARFFLEEPTQVEIDHSTKALGQLVTDGASPVEAWTGLCVGYMSSMRFLTF